MSAKRPRRTSNRTTPPHDGVAIAAPAAGLSAGRVSGGRAWWLYLGALAVVALAYQPAWFGGPLWDDPAHLTRPDQQSMDGLRRIWFELGATQQYYPLTHSAFWLMNRLWGHATLGYHIVNIALHAWSAFMLGLLLRRFKVPGALLAGAIFALHPVQVESVAWMTELKNTLSAALYLSAAWFFLNFDDTRRARDYAIALGLFVLALLSKTVTMTLPAALLVVYWWKRGRLTKQDVVPLLPPFVLGLGMGLVTAWVERNFIGADGADFQFTLVERCLIAGRVVWFYLSKLFWPFDLIFIYPRWIVDQGIWWQYLFPLAALALLAGAWLVRSRSRAPLAALLLFGGTLAPALGFVNVYPFQFSFVADHFQYLASMSIIALAAAGATMAARRANLSNTVRIGAAAVLLVALSALTFFQSSHYVDVETLYRTTITRNPDCWLAENNLGSLKLGQNKTDEAMAHFQAALRSRPDYAPAHNNLGAAWQKAGRHEDALAEFREAARLQPRFVDPRVNAGNTLRQMNRLDEAASAYEDALRVKPDHLEAQANLAGVLLQLGRPEEAVAHLQIAYRLRPGDDNIRRNLAKAYAALGSELTRAGRPTDAIQPLGEALKVDPNSVEALTFLADALIQLGRPADAVPHLQRVVQLLPSSREARMNLDRVLDSIATR